jgi:outer membrane protein assembly factor BamD
MHLRRPFLFLLALVLTGSGCASRGPAWDRMDPEELFARGIEQLRARRWSNAADAFQQLVIRYPTHQRVQEARFRLGEAYQGRREWVTAAQEFNRLAVDFPAGSWADDARFETCRSYYELAPRPQLDQEYTRSAIDHCNSLIAYYPDSDFLPRARTMIGELTSRLAEKEYLAGEHYFNRRAFDSAVIYYQVVANDFPGTPWAPRALLRIHQAYERLGYQQEASTARDRLLREYPESSEARQLAGAAISAQP